MAPSHAVFPGTFDPFTAGHLDLVDRVRRLFDRVTVLVAVNPDKEPASTQAQRVAAVRAILPPAWTGVAVTGWAGLTAAFCRDHPGAVIVRGVRDRADLRHERQLAAMNERMGISTLFVPTRPALASVSSTLARSTEMARSAEMAGRGGG
jgi:pantetheine-phosphate adenylyltransferase